MYPRLYVNVSISIPITPPPHQDLFKESCNLTMEKEEISTGGGNYGEFVAHEDSLVGTLDNRALMELPYPKLSQCVIPPNAKNEVELQFVETDAAARDEDVLVEIRLYVPPGENEENQAELLQKAILKQARIQTTVDKAIVTLPQSDCLFLYPRGRLEVNLYSTYFRLHGPKYDHRMPYDDVDRYFLLKKPDGARTFFFVIKLIKPIRQGQQRYSYLVLQTGDDEYSIEVNLTKVSRKELWILFFFFFKEGGEGGRSACV